MSATGEENLFDKLSSSFFDGIASSKPQDGKDEPLGLKLLNALKLKLGKTSAEIGVSKIACEITRDRSTECFQSLVPSQLPSTVSFSDGEKQGHFAAVEDLLEGLPPSLKSSRSSLNDDTEQSKTELDDDRGEIIDRLPTDVADESMMETTKDLHHLSTANGSPASVIDSCPDFNLLATAEEQTEFHSMVAVGGRYNRKKTRRKRSLGPTRQYLQSKSKQLKRSDQRQQQTETGIFSSEYSDTFAKENDFYAQVRTHTDDLADFPIRISMRSTAPFLQVVSFREAERTSAQGFPPKKCGYLDWDGVSKKSPVSDRPRSRPPSTASSNSSASKGDSYLEPDAVDLTGKFSAEAPDVLSFEFGSEQILQEEDSQTRPGLSNEAAGTAKLNQISGPRARLPTRSTGLAQDDVLHLNRLHSLTGLCKGESVTLTFLLLKATRAIRQMEDRHDTQQHKIGLLLNRQRSLYSQLLRRTAKVEQSALRHHIDLQTLVASYSKEFYRSP